MVTETLMFLPGDQGGLGLLDTEWLHSAAYVAAWRQTAETLEPHFSEWSHAEQLARLKKCGKFTANLQDLVARLRRCRNELSAADAEDLVVDELLSGPPKGTQKRLAALLAKERSDALAPSLEDDISRAAFRSAHGSEASSTFSGYYGDGVARLDNNDFRGRVYNTPASASRTMVCVRCATSQRTARAGTQPAAAGLALPPAPSATRGWRGPPRRAWRALRHR